jgi:hypothetical protein
MKRSLPAALAWRWVMHIPQHADAQPAVNGMDADLAVGPVVHRSPSELLSDFQAAEDALDPLLAGITGHNLFRRYPVPGIFGATSDIV